jgi:hypothetical protein
MVEKASTRVAPSEGTGASNVAMSVMQTLPTGSWKSNPSSTRTGITCICFRRAALRRLGPKFQALHIFKCLFSVSTYIGAYITGKERACRYYVFSGVRHFEDLG